MREKKTAVELAAMLIACVTQRPGCEGVSHVTIEPFNGKVSGGLRWGCTGYNDGNSSGGAYTIEIALDRCLDALRARYDLAE